MRCAARRVEAAPMKELYDLTLENFMTYREPQTVSLRRQGLVVIEGDNQLSAALDSNGAGKTAIPDALCWAFFNVTPRGRKGAAVANRFTSGPCVVQVRFYSATGEPSAIRRQVRPYALRLTVGSQTWSNEDAEKRITQVLGFGASTFIHGAYFGQGAFSRFASASQKEQLQTLDEIHGVSFKAALKVATRWKQAWSEELAAAVVNLTTVETRLAALEEQRAKAVAAARDAHTDGALNTLKQKLRAATEHRDKLQKLIATKPAALRARKLCEHAQNAVNEANEAVREAENAVAHWTHVVNRFETAASKLLRGEGCPTCGTVPKKGQTFPVVRDAETARKKLRDARIAYERAEAVAEQAAAVLEKRRAADTLDVVLDAERRLETAQEVVNLSQEALDNANATRRTDHAVVKQLNAEIAKLKTRRTQLTKARDGASQKVSVAKYWCEAFGDRGIRLRLFQSVAGFVTQRAAEHLQDLAGGEVAASVAADVVRGWEKVTVSAEWAHGGGTLDDQSAGQDRRVSLALFAALHDLAAQYAARGFPIRVFDEPSDGLDARGRELLHAWLLKQAQQSPTTLVITHDAGLDAELRPQAVWRVVLGPDGSRVHVV